MASIDSSTSTRRLGGFSVAVTSTDELVDLLLDRSDAGVTTEVYFANSNFILKCFPFAGALQTPESLIVNDGIAIDVASLIFFRKSFAENLNGTDFTPRLLARVRRPTRIFLLGARPDTVSRAAARLSAFEQIEVVGAVDGYDGLSEDAFVLRRLDETRPDILLVALGNPLQEQWVVTHRGKHRVPLVMAVGALFDFMAGSVSRAPTLIQRLKLEWFYRLMQEPRRLGRRYTIEMLNFFIHCARTNDEAARNRRHERASR